MDQNSFEDSDVNRWTEKSADEVFAEAFHELRNPIYLMVGYLNVLVETEVMPEQMLHFQDTLHRYALQSKHIVDSVYQYMNEKRKDQ